MNEVGATFCPYDAVSSFALEPSYASLSVLPGAGKGPLKAKIEDIRRRFPSGPGHIDYAVKEAKREVMEEIEQIEEERGDLQRDRFFKKFKVAEKREEIEDITEASARFTAMANGEELPIEDKLETPSKFSNLPSNFNSEEPQNP